MLIRKLVLALGVLPSLAFAQGEFVCAASPGYRLGIFSFDCTNCTVRNHDAMNIPYSVTFGAEPVVAETSQPSAFAKGDVIEAIDDDHLQLGVALSQGRFDRLGEEYPVVMAGHDHAHERPGHAECYRVAGGHKAADNRVFH